MAKLRNRSVKTLCFYVLRKTPTIIGCMLLLFSIISPFCSFFPYNPFWETRSITFFYYLSFRFYEERKPSGGEYQLYREYWFKDYWFDSEVKYFGLSGVLIIMFVTQILTLAAGITFVFTDRKALVYAPAILCPIIIALMTYTNLELSGTELGSFQQGYWLMYPSMILFLLSLTLSLDYRQEQYTPTHTQTQ